MQNSAPSLFTRPDTVFGVCEGIGEDFGFNAQILRVMLAAMLFWSPMAAVATYAGLALAVLLARRLFPNPVEADVSEADAPAEAVLRGENDEAPAELAAAA